MKLLREYRIKNGYSCQYMADQLKISKSFYWQMENDKRRLSYESAVKIADIFGLRPDTLFYEELKREN